MNNKQILIKTIIWRVVATSITFFTTWLITGSWEFGTAVSAIDFFFKSIGYFIYEKIWHKNELLKRN
jgi:uncharacterized membrane protein